MPARGGWRGSCSVSRQRLVAAASAIGLVAALERACNVPGVRGVFSEIETVENN
jgi:hypothetical protein